MEVGVVKVQEDAMRSGSRKRAIVMRRAGTMRSFLLL